MEGDNTIVDRALHIVGRASPIAECVPRAIVAKMPEHCGTREADPGVGHVTIEPKVLKL